MFLGLGHWLDDIVAGISKLKNIAPSNSNSRSHFQSENDTPEISFLIDGNQYVLDCVEDIDSLDLLAFEWQELEKNCPEPFVYFQSFDWCYQWCQQFAKSDCVKNGGEIRVYVLRRDAKVVLIWPMMVETSSVGFRTLTSLSEPHGQYANVLVDQKLLHVEAGNRVWEHIRKTNKVDAVIFDQYPKSSLLEEVIGGQGFVENSTKFSSILNLDALSSWDEYNAALPSKMRKLRNKRNNKLARQGKVDYEVHFGGTDNYRALLSLALDWKVAWLADTGRRASVLSSPDTKQFLENLPGVAPEELSKSVRTIPAGAVLGALTLDGQPIGIEIGMCLNGHYYSYLGAFDPAFKKLSPGKIQIENAQKWALEAGLSKFDFLGDPADYKSYWTDSKDELESRSIPVSIRGYLYCYAWKARIRPFVRQMFNALSSERRSKLMNALGLVKNKKTAPSPKAPLGKFFGLNPNSQSNTADK